MKLLKLLGNKDIILPIMSALGALISAICAGCKLCASNITLEVNPYNTTTNSVMEIIR